MSIITPSVYCGDAQTMPPVLQEATKNLRHKVLYWSATDPTLPLQKGIWCNCAGSMVFLPCYWPFLMVLAIPFCCVAWCGKQDFLARYIVVTEATVEIVEVEHDKCCIPGFYRKGQEINSIPLEQIVDVQTDTTSKGCSTVCTPEFTEIRILAPIDHLVKVRGGVVPGLAVYGHTDIQQLQNHIFTQRDIAKNRGKIIQVMQRDSADQSLEKISALKKMLDSGMITQHEFDEKKKDLLKNM